VILDPDVHVEGQFRFVAKQEIDAADQDVIHLLRVQTVEYAINIHPRPNRFGGLKQALAARSIPET
jgi:hypothetical protein